MYLIYIRLYLAYDVDEVILQYMLNLALSYDELVYIPSLYHVFKKWVCSVPVMSRYCNIPDLNTIYGSQDCLAINPPIRTTKAILVLITSTALHHTLSDPDSTWTS